MFIDESHVSIPQVGAMFKGDRSRKENLVNYGFRLPSALDNRPLRFDEYGACCTRQFLSRQRLQSMKVRIECKWSSK